MTYEIKTDAESAWAGWQAAIGGLVGAGLSAVGAPVEMVIAGTAFGAATGRVLTVILRRGLVKVGLGG